MQPRTIASTLVILLAGACSKSDTKSTSGTGSGAPAGPAATASANGYEGKLATSGLYAATWEPAPGSEANPFSSLNSLSLKSDHETWGNVQVKEDGSVSFGSGAKEFSSELSFKGSGAKVTMDETGKFVCAFSVDTDLAGARGGTRLHLLGAMTVHWHPEGLGGINCP